MMQLMQRNQSIYPITVTEMAASKRKLGRGASLLTRDLAKGLSASVLTCCIQRHALVSLLPLVNTSAH